jgi:O-antigen ligase
MTAPTRSQANIAVPGPSANSGTGALQPAGPTAPTVSSGARKAVRASRIVRFAFILYAASVALDAVPVLGGIGVARIFAVILAAAALTQPNLSLRRPAAPFWWFAMYLAIALVSGVPHLDWYGEAIAQRGLTIAQNLILFWMVSNLLTDEELSGHALVAMVFMGAVVALLMGVGIGQSAVHTSRGVRLSFVGVNPNFLGGVLSLCLLAVLGMMLTSRLVGRAWRWAGPALAMPLLGALVATGSRGAMGGFAFGMFILILSGERLSRRVRNVVLFGLAGVAAYVTVYATSISRIRWGEAVEERQVSGRERIYPEALRMIGERPLQGWGMENHRRELGRRVPQLSSGSLDTHNLYLYVLTEVGILGSIPFWIGLALAVRGAWRARRTPHGMLPMVLLSAMLVSNLATTGIVTKPLWFVLAYAVAGGIAAGKQRRQEAKSKRQALRIAEGPASGSRWY